MDRTDRLAGITLIAVGVLLFVVLQADVGGEVVVAMVGATFLIAYAFTRAYGFLVPGGILTGLGTGVILQAQGYGDTLPVLGLGSGFLAIALVDLATHGQRPAGWWPLIPGGILTLVGLSELSWGEQLLRWWPVLLVAAGAWLVTAGRRPRRTPPPATDTSTAPSGHAAEEPPAAPPDGPPPVVPPPPAATPR